MRRISILLSIKYSKENNTELSNLKKDLEKQYRKMKKKEKYFEQIKSQKDKIQKRIDEIKETLDDDEKIKKEYVKRNRNLPLEKKIFSIRILFKILLDEKKDLTSDLEKLIESEKEENYEIELRQLEEQLRYLRLVDVNNKEELITDLIIIMQKIFLQGINGKINQVKSKEELIDLIYQYRYYCMIPFTYNKLMYEVEELKEDINSVGKFLIEKSTALKLLSSFSKNSDLNYEILKNIYTTRIISLEELNIKITKEKEKYYVQLFDDNIFDEKIEIEFNRKIIKKDFSAKLNKKIRLFV